MKHYLRDILCELEKVVTTPTWATQVVTVTLTLCEYYLTPLAKQAALGLNLPPLSPELLSARYAAWRPQLAQQLAEGTAALKHLDVTARATWVGKLALTLVLRLYRLLELASCETDDATTAFCLCPDGCPLCRTWHGREVPLTTLTNFYTDQRNGEHLYCGLTLARPTHWQTEDHVVLGRLTLQDLPSPRRRELLPALTRLYLAYPALPVAHVRFGDPGDSPAWPAVTRETWQPQVVGAGPAITVAPTHADLLGAVVRALLAPTVATYDLVPWVALHAGQVRSSYDLHVLPTAPLPYPQLLSSPEALREGACTLQLTQPALLRELWPTAADLAQLQLGAAGVLTHAL